MSGMAFTEWRVIMMYGDDSNARSKENLYDAIRDFLKDHCLYELMQIITDVLQFDTPS